MATIEHDPKDKQTKAIAINEPTELAELPTHGSNALDQSPGQFTKGLERRKKNRDALITWVREALVEGVDFGRIKIKKKAKAGDTSPPKYAISKPSLWKPGAEKITGMLGVTVTYPNMMDYEQAVLTGAVIKQIMIRCHLINPAGQIVAEGVGARSLAQDGNDLNKAMKMAQKSAHIDAVLRMAGLSEIFTQDADDLKDGDDLAEDDKATGKDDLPIGDDCCPIGKEWRGQPWNMVDTGFLEWIIKSIDDKPDLVKAAKLEIGKRSAPVSQAAEAVKTANVTPALPVTEYVKQIKNAQTLDELTVIAFEIPENIRTQINSLIQDRESVLFQNSIEAP